MYNVRLRTNRGDIHVNFPPFCSVPHFPCHSHDYGSLILCGKKAFSCLIRPVLDYTSALWAHMRNLTLIRLKNPRQETLFTPDYNIGAYKHVCP